jgi:hypothetical protein
MTTKDSPPTQFFCDHYKGGPDDICIMFKPGPWEYSCLSKKSIYLKCPWMGKPWQQPLGFCIESFDKMMEAVKNYTAESTNEKIL